MGLPRDIVDSARTITFDPFSDGALDALAGEPTSEQLMKAIGRATGASDTAASLLLALQCLSIQRAEAKRTALEAEFVATAPRGAVAGVRPTAVVVREMLSGARSEILTLGYIVTSEGGLIELLHAAAQRGVCIDVVCDREAGSAQHIVAAWPLGIPPPRLYVNAPVPEASDIAKMHCKLLLVDSSDLLLTSANFTFHGLRANIEFGIRVRGQEALLAKNFFEHLRRQQLVEPIQSS